MIPEKELRIERLSSLHDISDFDSGNEELNDFLKNDSIRDQRNLISKTHLCFWNNHLAGFITLAADSVQVKRIDRSDHMNGYRYSVYPCLLIGRLAVDIRFQRNGVGNFLLLLALGLAIDGPIGCRYLSVDSKVDAVTFYQNAGFRFMERQASKQYPRMYLNVCKIIEKIRQRGSSI
jgi:predicted GNAT family N-acyltransferase